RARTAIAGHILRTPLVSSHSLGERIGAEAFLKLENLQRTGSFKVRGAVNAMSRLSPEARRAGVVTMSAGNAAQAIAYAGRAQGVRVTVVMPEGAPRTKIEATRGGGGLISGIARAVKALRPSARIVGVEPEGAQGVRKALDAGHVVRLDAVKTVADGLAAPFAGERNLEIIKRDVDDVVVISDETIIDGLQFLVARARVVAEPAGGAAVGPLLDGAVRA